MSFNTSTPSKKPLTPSPDDSGVSIQLSELGEESEKMLGSTDTDSACKSNEVIMDMEDGKQEQIQFMVKFHNDLSTESEGSDSSGTLTCFIVVHSTMTSFITNNSSRLKKIILVLLAVLYLAYFKAALVFHAIHFCPDNHNVLPLIVLTCVVLLLIVISYVSSRFGEDIREKLMLPVARSIDNHWNVLKWVVMLLPLAGIVAVIVITVKDSPKNLASLAGLAFFIIILFIFSSHPTRVNWRPVIGGFVLQFCFATLILKWDVGYKVFSFLGEEARKFLAYTDVGAEFVFGKKFTDHIFAMKVLPVVVFFSCVITMLYHLGIMQAVISKIAFVMRCTLGTTAAESLCAAGNIFVGQTEAPILIRPFLSVMTKSELHAVMVGGFATIAGGVLAAYISFGIPPEHLLCASVMNAPCALAVSKLLYPETEKSKISKTCAMTKGGGQYRNILEAAAAGASQSIALVANIAANLIAFLALLAFVNATLAWFGAFVCLPNLSFESICHYLLMPVVYLMGVRWEDAGHVAELIALKTFLNEFVAYEKLSEFINARLTCDDSIHILSPRSEIIATYALCGFSNLSSIGIMLGGLGPMAPQRVGDMAQIVVSALFGGVVACLITASVAGLLVVEVPSDLVSCMVAMGNDTLAGNVSLVVDVVTQNASNVADLIVTTASAAV
ncbi:hypothetical protein BaRGS_00024832 [Batillaria attramentaria]|uniref:Sodium/nucleoside cotransporter n=1 Tax=Batillaria attramentaria TaxID=370345 RepID=A0ABD0KA34_9CAEN